MANRCAPITQIETLSGNISAATYFDGPLAAAPNALNDSSLGYVNGVPVDTGSANNYIVTLPFGVPTNYQQGMTVTFKAVNANTGNSTLTVSPLTAIQLVNVFGNPLVQGDIPAGTVLSCTYNGSAFVVMSPIASNVLAAGPGNFANARVLFDDFVGYPLSSAIYVSGAPTYVNSQLPWVNSTSPGSSLNFLNYADSTNKAFGVLGSSTSGANGIARIILGPLPPALGPLEMDARVQVSQAPNSTDNFQFIFGLQDFNLSLVNNSISFLGTFSSGSILEGFSVSGGVSSATSTIPLTGAPNFMRLRMLINAAWTSVSFFLIGVQIGSAITTNIPTGISLFPVVSTIKTAGAAPIGFEIDQFYMSYLYNS